MQQQKMNAAGPERAARTADEINRLGIKFLVVEDAMRQRVWSETPIRLHSRLIADATVASQVG